MLFNLNQSFFYMEILCDNLKQFDNPQVCDGLKVLSPSGDLGIGLVWDNLSNPKELDDHQLFDDPSFLMIPSYSMIPRYSMISSYSMIPSYTMIN